MTNIGCSLRQAVYAMLTNLILSVIMHELDRKSFPQVKNDRCGVSAMSEADRIARQLAAAEQARREQGRPGRQMPRGTDVKRSSAESRKRHRWCLGCYVS